MQNDITICDLGPQHLAAAHRLSMQESWPHRAEDWALQLSLSRGLAAVTDGRLIGTALLTPYGDNAATCNMIIVAPSARGKGLGRHLMERLLQMTGDRECRLIATASGLPLYERLGFVATGEIVQYQGTACAIPAPVTAPADLAEVMAMDRAATGMNREDLLRALFAQSPFLTVRDDAGLQGFVAPRLFGRGQLAGPLIARDDAAAEALLHATIAAAAGGFLRVDLAPDGAGFAPLLSQAGLSHVGGGVAMVRAGRKDAAPQGAAKAYALASQAFC